MPSPISRLGVDQYSIHAVANFSQVKVKSCRVVSRMVTPYKGPSDQPAAVQLVPLDLAAYKFLELPEACGWPFPSLLSRRSVFKAFCMADFTDLCTHLPFCSSFISFLSSEKSQLFAGPSLDRGSRTRTLVSKWGVAAPPPFPRNEIGWPKTCMWCRL